MINMVNASLLTKW